MYEYGWWRINRPVILGGREVTVDLFTGDRPPGDREADLVQRISGHWPDVWPSVLSKLAATLKDDAPVGGRARFLKDVRPASIVIYRDHNSIDVRWELRLAPDVYGGHVVLILMRDLECGNVVLDG